MPSGNATVIRNLLATQDLLRTLLLQRQGDAKFNEKLVVELSSMGDFSTNTWNIAVSLSGSRDEGIGGHEETQNRKETGYWDL
jgi:hypothetical protein